jgi:hypothetical protein
MTGTISETLTLTDITNAPHFDIADVYFWDYDRTLGEVEPVRQRIADAGQGLPIDWGLYHDAVDRIEDDGGSAQPFMLIREQLTPDEYQQYCDSFQRHPLPLLYKDAMVLMETVHESPVTPNFIVTAAADMEGQAVKVAGSGVTSHFEVVPIKLDEQGIPRSGPKGPELAKWIGSRGTFDVVAMDGTDLLAVLHAKTGILVDDKKSALQELPAQARAVHLERLNEKRTKSQSGELPEGALVINSLTELIPHMSKTPIPGLELPATTRFVPVLTALGHNI